MKSTIKLLTFCSCFILAACSMSIMKPNNQYSSNTSSGILGESNIGAGTAAGVPIGGSIARSMDELDRAKLSRALDKAPGTPTTWVNAGNGTQYTVTPIKKVAVNGNSLCREYQVSAMKNGSMRQSSGTACVAADGAWSEVNG